MTQECKRAAAIVDKIVVGTGDWSELFAKHDFFYKYRYYLQIIASTGNSELQRKWCVRISLFNWPYFIIFKMLAGRVPLNPEYAS